MLKKLSGRAFNLTRFTEEEAEKQCQNLVDAFVKENPNAER